MPCGFCEVYVLLVSEIVILVSEIVILRKELHEMHFKLDDMTNAKQCAEAKVKTLRLDLADAHADKS